MNNDFMKAAEHLDDRMWRLNHLYYILDKSGNKVLFKMNDAQASMLENIWYLNIVLKARQRGFTTLFCILMLDACLFNANIRAGIIADNIDNVEVIFRDKIRFAYDNLPPVLKDAIETEQDQAKELLFKNNSSIRVGTSMRSGTLQYLLVSEFGKICRKYPEKAKEVVTGSLQAVQAGQFVFIESTAEGQGGRFYEMCQDAQNDLTIARKLSQMDYRFHFYSWWDAAEYEIEPDNVVMTEEDHQYFNKIEEIVGAKISERKRAWYVSKRKTLKEDMKQEFPSTPQEAFEQAIEGAYYANEMSHLRMSKQICKAPEVPGLPVDTYWDLGRNDMNAIWFRQQVGIQDRFIRYYENSGENLAHYAKYIKETGYLIGRFFVPHDAAHKLLGQEYAVDEQIRQMFPGAVVVVVPRIPNIIEGINLVREVLPRVWIDEENCAKGITHLDNYRKEWNEKLGVWRNVPLHDTASNGADAFRQYAQSYRSHTPGNNQTSINRTLVRSSWRT